MEKKPTKEQVLKALDEIREGIKNTPAEWRDGMYVLLDRQEEYLRNPEEMGNAMMGMILNSIIRSEMDVFASQNPKFKPS